MYCRVPMYLYALPRLTKNSHISLGNLKVKVNTEMEDEDHRDVISFNQHTSSTIMCTLMFHLGNIRCRNCARQSCYLLFAVIHTNLKDGVHFFLYIILYLS